MNRLAFVKVQGNGNDFILLDGIGEALPALDWGALARVWCQRRYVIGADGLLLALPSEVADYRMRLFNADGSEAEMCGNGIRCLAHFLFNRYAPDAEALRIETGAGVREVFRACPDASQIRVAMGAPRLARAEIPAAGTPPDQQIGPQVENHPLFPQRTNFQVARVHARNEVEVRTWERGAGATLACGTGACAVVVIGVLTGRLEPQTVVHMPGGDLLIHWENPETLWMTGPAQIAFEGTAPLPPSPV